MKKLLKNKKGFTLVELMVVVIIVGILAAVAVPLYRSNLKRAMSTEGVAIVGSVRTAERVYYAEKELYTTSCGDLGMVLADVSGNKYFTALPTITSADATHFVATITGVAGGSLNVVVTINEAGTITVSGL